MNVLSLFDGISCGMVALERANIKIDKYYASEINKYAIEVSRKNYPKIIQLGDIKNIDTSKLPKIDLIIGGSPCQNLSNCQTNGKGLNGKKSILFLEFAKILKDYQKINPNILFLLENVKMKQEWKNAISKILNIEPIEINSNLLSAQDRKRLYWTNIPNVNQPKENNIILKNIILPHDKIDDKYWYQESFTFHGENKKIIATINLNGHDILKRVNNINFKSPTLTACTGGNHQKKIFQNNRCRKLTPMEYERLQTLPDNYTEGLSMSQRYNVLGDGWTVDIIAHILSFIPHL